MKWIPDSDESIEGVSRRLADGEITCSDLVHQCLKRIDEREEDVKAWVVVDRDGAIRAAEQLDDELKRSGPRGPLHGIPIGIKDIVDVAGFPTAAGFALLAETVVAEDSEVVRRLRAAGAIILGKTVTTQFACYDPPETRNPWNLDRTPGGSSSGSAAAVADKMCFAAIGSQTGGSITRPASFCGVAGCKPTFGRVSRRGVVPIAENLDHVGPLARTVGDLAIVVDAISGFDAADPYCVDAVATSLSTTQRGGVDVAPRLGIPGGDFDAFADEEMKEARAQAIQKWSAAGAEIVDIDLPRLFESVAENHRRVMAVEGAAFHEQRYAEFRGDYLPGISTLVEEGLAESPTAYARSRAHQVQITRDFEATFSGVDALICPATLGEAPDRSTTGDPRFNIPWSYTGLPVVSFPVAVSGAGLPLALQLIGKAFDESRLFRAALWCASVIAN